MREIKTLQSAIDKADKVKVTILRSVREDNVTSREILCSNCGRVSMVQDQTLTRWVKKGIQYCSMCNGVFKSMSPENKVNSLNAELPIIYKSRIEVVEYLGYKSEKQHSYCLVRFKDCGHTKEYCCVTLRQVAKQGKSLKCDVCSNSGSAGEYWASKILPNDFDPQVPYACIATTKRRWIADFYSESRKMIIEITTEGQLRTDEYSNNIKEKKEWCQQEGITLVIIDNINKLEDIVQSL